MLKNVLIGTSVAYTSAASPYLLASGEIGVYAQNPTTGALTLTTTANVAAQVAAGNDFVIAQGVPAGGNVRLFTIKRSQKRAYLNTAYTAPVPNVFNIGFDGTNFDLVSGAAGSYGFKVFNMTLGNQPFPTYSTTPFFQLPSQATSIAIASAAVKDINAQVALAINDVMPEQRFAYAEILSNATTAALTSTPSATVVNGSDIVTLSVSSTDAVVGNWLRIGSATVKTLPVYQIVEVISATQVRLATPYYNASSALGTSTAAVVIGFATNATVAAAAAGIRVTEWGNVFNGSSILEAYPNKTLSVAVFGNASGTPFFGNGTVAKSYLAANGTITSGVYTEGAGTFPQIRKKELVAAGYQGWINRTFIPDAFPLYSVAGTNYVTLGLEYRALTKDFSGDNKVVGEILNAIIAIPSGASQITDLNTILAAI